MKVRILRQPLGSVHGVNLNLYKPRLVYDLPATLADYLVTCGFARLEMRMAENSHPPRGIDERRQPPQY